MLTANLVVEEASPSESPNGDEDAVRSEQTIRE
jgi:hypothetical protein